MFKKFKSANLKKYGVLLTCRTCLRFLNESILLLGIWLELKVIYLYMYYKILVYWVFLAHFSFTLPLFKQYFFFSVSTFICSPF